MNENGQLRVAHLVLGYQPLSCAFQDIGQAIRVGSPRLARIDVSKPKFLARQDLKPVVLPGIQNPLLVAQLPPPDNLQVAAQAEAEGETESSRLSLEEEIDEFYFEEEIPKSPLTELLDPEGEQDRNSVVGALIIIAYSEDSSDEEVDNMASNKGKILRKLMASRGKGQSSKVPSQPQIPVLPPVAPQLPSDLGLKVNPDLKKKRPVETLEEGEVGPRQGKQQKTTQEQKNKRAPSVESREEENRAEVRVNPRTWSPKLEVDGVAIPYTALVREYNRGRAGYIAEALKQPVLLHRDMKAYRRFSQPKLFLSLKKDLTMVK